MATGQVRSSEQRTIVSSWVPLSVARELQVRAALEDRSLSAEIRRALNAHLHASEMRR